MTSLFFRFLPFGKPYSFPLRNAAAVLTRVPSTAELLPFKVVQMVIVFSWTCSRSSLFSQFSLWADPMLGCSSRAWTLFVNTFRCSFVIIFALHSFLRLGIKFFLCVILFLEMKFLSGAIVSCSSESGFFFDWLPRSVRPFELLFPFGRAFLFATKFFCDDARLFWSFLEILRGYTTS